MVALQRLENLAAGETLPPHVAATGAIAASLVSAWVNLPVVARLAGTREFTRRLAWVLGSIRATRYRRNGRSGLLASTELKSRSRYR